MKPLWWALVLLGAVWAYRGAMRIYLAFTAPTEYLALIENHTWDQMAAKGALSIVLGAALSWFAYRKARAPSSQSAPPTT